MRIPFHDVVPSPRAVDSLYGRSGTEDRADTTRLPEDSSTPRAPVWLGSDNLSRLSNVLQTDFGDNTQSMVWQVPKPLGILVPRLSVKAAVNCSTRFRIEGLRIAI